MRETSGDADEGNERGAQVREGLGVCWMRVRGWRGLGEGGGEGGEDCHVVFWGAAAAFADRGAGVGWVLAGG
jgi:hypothetical protein